MTRLSIALLCVIQVAGFDAPTTASQIPARESIAIAGVAVIDVAGGRTLLDQTVLVSDGRITAAGAARSVAVPSGARTIDGRGKFLIPGLIDSHMHLALGADRDKLRALGPLLAHGVTGVRDAGTGGQDEWLVALRGRAERGEILSPRIYVSGMVSGRAMARSGAGAGALARRLIDLGVDGLKIRDGLSGDDIRAVVAVAAAAKRPVYGHTYDAVSRERDEIYTLEAVRDGIAGSMHVMGMPQVAGERPAPPDGPRFAANWERWWLHYALFWLRTDPAAERALIQMMIERGAWLEPTLVTEDWIVNPGFYRDEWTRRRLPGAFEASRTGFPAYQGTDLQQYRDAFGRMQDFVRRFHAAGGVVTAGTDCVPVCGFGIQDELRLLVSAGLTPAAALRTATSDAARVLGWADRTGRIAPGLAADLVLLDADPMQDIRNTSRVHAVIAQGRFLDRRALDALIATLPPK